MTELPRHDAATEVLIDFDRRLRLVEKARDQRVAGLTDLSGRNQLVYYPTLERGTLELTGAGSAFS